MNEPLTIRAGLAFGLDADPGARVFAITTGAHALRELARVDPDGTVTIAPGVTAEDIVRAVAGVQRAERRRRLSEEHARGVYIPTHCADCKATEGTPE